MEIINKKLKDLKPYRNNPRKNIGAIRPVKESILQFGFKVPIVIDQKNEIICGHTRYYASQEIGLETVPCIIAEDLNEEQIKAFRLVDNRTSEFADWNFDKLAEELSEIDTIDLSSFGFDDLMAGLELDYNLNQKDKEAIEDDYDAEPPAEPKTKVGDFFQLGNHYLLCGSSLSSKDVQRLLQGKEMDLCVTDPPYGVSLEDKYEKQQKLTKNRERKKNSIHGDDLRGDSLYNFLLDFYQNMKDALKEGGAYYIWYSTSDSKIFINALEETGLIARQIIVWNKNTFTLSRSDYQHKYEPCLYGWKEGKAHYFINDRTLATILDEEPKIDDLNKFTKGQLIDLIERITAEQKADIIDCEKPLANKLYPTMKPIKLIGEQIQNSSKPRENVVDFFGGSGTTLIACEQLGRNCYMMEYDPAYCDVIIDRWEKLTGKKAEKING